MSKTICCAGQANNGKDLVADYLVQRLNSNNRTGVWVRSAFANAVKEVYQNAFGVDREFIEKWKRLPEPPPGMLKNVRQGLQLIGDGFRQIKDDIWIDIALRGNQNRAISDSRYINEAMTIKNLNGITILIWRPSFENDDPNPSESQMWPTIDWFIRSGLEGYVGNMGLPCTTECRPDLFDFFIRNDGSVQDLYRKLDEVLVPYIEGRYGKSNLHLVMELSECL